MPQPEILQLLPTIIAIVTSGTVLAAIIAGIFSILSDRAAEKKGRRDLELEYKLNSIQSMWKKSDEYMTKYYFPLATAALGLSTKIERWLESKDDSTLLSIFYWYVRFRQVAVQMSKVSVYMILTSFVAEKCGEALFYRILSAPGYSDLELSTLSLQLGQNITLFEMNKKVQGEVKEVYSKFIQFVQRDKTAVERLSKEAKYFNSLMTAEINKLYEQWYGEKYVPSAGQTLKDIASYLGLS